MTAWAAMLPMPAGVAGSAADTRHPVIHASPAIAEAHQHGVQPHAWLGERRRQRAVRVQVAQTAVGGKADAPSPCSRRCAPGQLPSAPVDRGVPTATASYAAHASYMHVCAIASARATIGGPLRNDRLQAHLGRPAAVPVADDGGPARSRTGGCDERRRAIHRSQSHRSPPIAHYGAEYSARHEPAIVTPPRGAQPPAHAALGGKKSVPIVEEPRRRMCQVTWAPRVRLRPENRTRARSKRCRGKAGRAVHVSLETNSRCKSG
jgi:hypothetical protein